MPMGGYMRGGATVEANPDYIAPDPWKPYYDEQGNVTLCAWQSMFSLDVATGFRNTPGAWNTAVILPLDRHVQVLEAWYGHPSDPSRRVDIKDRVNKLLAGPKNLPGGVAISSGPFFQDGQLYLMADTALWGEDPAPWTWKKLEVRFRPTTS
mmetsp:Transcript_35290/g.63464  ORF Transcript_35290/g.63464 Transcript_35290/m.63464 type:complete len:152 (+) Transcript_35290:60-515(+)